MDAGREGLIQRLLQEGRITQDEAYLLSRKEIEYIPQPPIIPFPEIGRRSLSVPQDWLTREAENRQRIADNCSCNPRNGGSGICGCTLTGQIIT